MLEENPDQISLSDVPAEVVQEWIHFQHTEELSPEALNMNPSRIKQLLELAVIFFDVGLCVKCLMKLAKEESSSSEEEDVDESEEGQGSEGRWESDEEATSGVEESYK